jgi:hypothetical protein
MIFGTSLAVIKCKEWKISLIIIVIPLLRGWTG